MSNKLKLQDHATDLQFILDTINALPEAGAGDAYAVIGVTYPEGSICTCFKGSETLELDNDVGYGFFLVPEDGRWTVSCTDKVDSTKTKSVEIEITKEGQWESVVLGFGLDIIKNGYAKVEFNLADTPVENDGDGYYRCWEARYLVDVTNYSALKIDGMYLAGNGGAGNVDIQVLYESNALAAKQVLTTARDTYTIDLSEQTGIRQIYWRTYGYNTDTQGYKSSIQVFYNMWLEQ